MFSSLQAIKNVPCNNKLFSWTNMRYMHAQMDRLYVAAKILKGITSPTALARALNQSAQTVKNWESRGISKGGMLAAQQFIGCSANWIETGDGEMSPSGVPSNSPTLLASDNLAKYDSGLTIPVFDASASMGTGYAAPDHDVIVGGLQVHENWVKQNLGSVSSPKNLAVIPAYGDSMTPTFSDGDLLLVDRGIGDIRLDAVYVLGLNGELFIKRLQRRPDGSLLMISDNKSYEPYKIQNGEKDSFSVLGRVVWAWAGKKL